MFNLYNRRPSTFWCHLWRNRYKWRCESWAEACGYGAGAAESQVMLLQTTILTDLILKSSRLSAFNLPFWFHTSHHQLCAFFKMFLGEVCEYICFFILYSSSHHWCSANCFYLFVGYACALQLNAFQCSSHAITPIHMKHIFQFLVKGVGK